MSELSYFQRYSQRENHITNNVLLMLRMLYRQHPSKLQTVIEGVLTQSDVEDLELEVGPVFKQQQVASDSIPDAIIHQQPFVVMVEVKPGDKWNRPQIKRHIKSAKSLGERNTVLLLLSKAHDPMFDTKLIELSKKSNVRLVHSTFETLINLIDSEAVVALHETNLRDVVDDFKDLLWEEDLLDDPYEMFAFGCSQTLEWNLENRIYYDHLSRPSKANVLTGFYSKKEIHAIGSVTCTVVGSPAKGWTVESKHKSKSDKDVIKDVKNRVKSTAGDFSEEPLRWYIYDELFKTSFKKSTPYGYYGHEAAAATTAATSATSTPTVAA